VDNSTPGSPFYFDRLWLALDAAATIEVRMQSSAVNPFLYLYDLVADSVVMQNDDSGVGTTAAYINYAAPDFSIFELGLATSTSNQTGAYTVTITGPVSVAGAGLARAGALFALPELLRRDQRVTDPSAAGARSRAARSRGRYSP
jgi:hypothetical protein